MRANLATFLDDFRRHGDARAIVAHRGNRSFSYSWNDLAGLANRFAAELIRRQVPMGERVVLWGQNGLEWMGAFFGCLQRGVIAVPLDPAGAADFASRVIASTTPRLIVGDADLLRGLGAGPPRLAFEEFASVLLPVARGNLREPKLTLDTPFQILFTSGTTAEPKGIVHTHRNVLASLDPIEREMQKYLKYERIFHPIRFLHTLPLSHVFGQFMALWIPPLMAAEVHFENRLQAQRLIDTIHGERISVVCSVPRVLDLLRAHLLASDPDLRGDLEAVANEKVWTRWWNLRRVHRLFGYKFWAFVCGGASLAPELESFWTTLGFALIQGYGMTETSALITLNHPFKPGKGTIGKVLPGRDVRITDEGEILVRGPMVSQSTWQQGHMRQNEDEWLATGDLAQRDEQGQLRFVGRKSQVIVTPSGLNVHPEDVEAALDAQPGVQASAVVPLLTTAGTEPVAVLLFRGSREEAQQAIVAGNQRLAEYQQVRQWRLWPELDFPRTSTGKIRRPKVTEWVNAQRAEDGTGAEGDPLLALILSITHASTPNATNSAQLSEDLGLDSLGRVQLQSELEQRLGLTIDDEDLERVITLGDLRRELGMDHAAPAVEVFTRPLANRFITAPATPPEGVPWHLIPDIRERGEQDVYPRWPWWWPVRLLRIGFLELIAQPLVRLLARPRVERTAPLRQGKPMLIIANHVTTYDMPLVQYGLPGWIRRRMAAAMAGDMLRDWQHLRNLAPGLNWMGPVTWLLVTALYNAFPLPRSAGFRRSFQHAGEALDRGYNVLVFPEGHRTESGLQPFRPGIGLLVRDSGVPVLPVALAGLSELKAKGRGWFRSGALTVRVGQPIEFAPGESPEAITAKLYEALRGMLLG
ncbi:MAG TPA: AMP-binding protein [Acidobacteriaceae bacterium]|nr:AMP-binding protein [Acidobacteriaceae bacterium]